MRVVINKISKTISSTQSLHEGKLPILKGHFLTHEDQVIRQAILDLVCRGRLNWDIPLLGTLDKQTIQDWRQMQQEGLLEMNECGLKVTPLGKAFVRNVAMVLDKKLREAARVQAVLQFSKAI